MLVLSLCSTFCCKYCLARALPLLEIVLSLDRHNAGGCGAFELSWHIKSRPVVTLFRQRRRHVLVVDCHLEFDLHSLSLLPQVPSRRH